MLASRHQGSVSSPPTRRCPQTPQHTHTLVRMIVCAGHVRSVRVCMWPNMCARDGTRQATPYSHRALSSCAPGAPGRIRCRVGGSNAPTPRTPGALASCCSGTIPPNPCTSPGLRSTQAASCGLRVYNSSWMWARFGQSSPTRQPEVRCATHPHGSPFPNVGPVTTIVIGPAGHDDESVKKEADGP